jgi:hypothetical protein
MGRRKPIPDPGEVTPYVKVMRSLAARYPPHGAWSGEMRADMTAAYFDYATTGELWKAIARGEAPRPSSTRLRNGRREPIWALDICRAHVARRHEINNDVSLREENIGSLV